MVQVTPARLLERPNMALVPYICELDWLYCIIQVQTTQSIGEKTCPKKTLQTEWAKILGDELWLIAKKKIKNISFYIKAKGSHFRNL